MSELYPGYSYSVNDKNFRTDGIKATKPKNLRNCYDDGEEKYVFVIMNMILITIIALLVEL